MALFKSVLFIDAYDSFSQNIVALLHQELGVAISLIEIDTNVEKELHTSLEAYVATFDAIILGPGPGNPNYSHDVGLLYGVYDAATASDIPVLGICLGFQVLCVKYGLQIDRMKEPCHGQAKKISIFPRQGDEKTDDTDDNIFEGIAESELQATCYNSLGLSLSNALHSPNSSRPGSSGTNASFSTTSSQSSSYDKTLLRVLATDQESNVMAIRHNFLPFWGVQFHPESCKSNYACRQLIRNWWNIVQKRNEQSCLYNQKAAITDLSGPLTTLTAQGKIATPSPSTELILNELLKISVTTSKTVLWEAINAPCNLEQLSELIHDVCGTGNVAMLESTKKGRFSIYAVLAEDQCMQQHDDQTTQYFISWHAQYQRLDFAITSTSLGHSFRTVASREEVWDALTLFMTHKRATGGPDEVPFWGGFLGFLSYEQGLDALGVSGGSTDRSVPEISLLWVERSVVYDNLTNKVYILSIRQNDHSFIRDTSVLLSSLGSVWSRSHHQSALQTSHLQKVLETAVVALPDNDQYRSNFYQCQAELRAGNSYELCLTTEATISIPKLTPDQPYEFELYRNLHAHNPVPFGAFLKLPGITILGTSPEQYMSWSRTGTIDMIPMKGTVKRSPAMTFERASAILSSAKESAENLMIADLIRHDLYSAVGHTANVEVVKLCEVVEHETVYQLVSHIRAHAPIDQHLSDDEKQIQAIHYGLKTLQQTVPPGSMTGAPKKRSCEILSQLEQRNRGLYSGVLGYMDVGGGGNWSVCIRTAFRCDEDQAVNSADHDVWHLGAGGAITVLSDAEGEWQEMMVKLNSVLKGFQVVKNQEA